jgi:small subunit ribosomal protein S6
MRQYELVTILPSEDDMFRQGKESVTGLLAQFGATDVVETDMGDRPLAYEIKKKQRGHYLLHTSNLDPQNVVPLEKAIKLSPNILKYLLVKVEV